ncbi:uncharacterized protein LOC143566707 [Bidens hawaiensis]|uniref:uncharacterized protein LOC143566707 n=1 Tax=Bidens hawaiensis TaxID=980011 RepID=UPI004049F99E
MDCRKMDNDNATPVIAKKLCIIIRAIVYMVKKGIIKTIPWLELHTMLKRSTKAIGNLLLDHQPLTCRPNNIHTTFIAPVEYEFSCSNTPLFNYHRRSNKHNKRHGRDQLTVSKVRKVFDILNSYEEEEEEITVKGMKMEMGKSPLTLLGFGKSPDVPRLRVTDSPFTVNDTEEDTIQVS